MLDKQIRIYALDTANFYSKTEHDLHWHINKVKAEKKELSKKLKEIDADSINVDAAEEELADKGVNLDKVFDGESNSHGNGSMHGEDLIDELCMEIDLTESTCDYVKSKWLKRIMHKKNVAAKNAKNKLKRLLEKKVEANIASNGTHHERVLDEGTLTEKNVIAVFESYFTRTIGAKQDELSEDFMVVTQFYPDVMKDLIYHGFMYKGEKYVYFTSSAGQIRTKKCVFVKESVWLKHQKTIMCGLTVDDINAKGGNNPN